MLSHCHETRRSVSSPVPTRDMHNAKDKLHPSPPLIQYCTLITSSPSSDSPTQSDSPPWDCSLHHPPEDPSACSHLYWRPMYPADCESPVHSIPLAQLALFSKFFIQTNLLTLRTLHLSLRTRLLRIKSLVLLCSGGVGSRLGVLAAFRVDAFSVFCSFLGEF